ncbi:hybrid sensor histidine kinase/response regulator [Segatella asaccharophila]
MKRSLCGKLHVSVSCILILFSLTFYAKEWKYYHLDNDNGLSNSSINTIFQDHTGVMWFGTWDGLNRFDGNEFRQYGPEHNNPHSLSHPVIRNIAEEDNTYLWIVTDRGLNRFNIKSGNVDRYYLQNRKNYIYKENEFKCVANKRKGIIATLESNKFYKFNPQAKHFDKLRMPYLHISEIENLFFDAHGFLWIQGNKRLYKVNIGRNGSCRLINIINPAKGTERVHFDGKRYIWAQAGKRLYKYDTFTKGKGFTVTPWSIEGTLNAVCITTKAIYAGTTDGCWQLSGNKKEGLITGVSVLSLYAGERDILWIGTDGHGIYEYYRHSSFIHKITLNDGKVPVNFPVRSILLDRKDNLWIGSKGGGLACMTINKEKKFQKRGDYNVGPGKTNNSVLSLCNGTRGRIWIGTDGYGLLMGKEGLPGIRPVKFRSAADREKVYSIYAIIQDGERVLYVGSSGGGLLKLLLDPQGESVIQVKEYLNDRRRNTIESNIVYSIINDGHYLWIGTRGGGLERFDKKAQTFTTFYNTMSSNSLSSDDVISLLKDRQGRIWAGTTQGLNLMVIRNGQIRFRCIDKRNGLANANIHGIQEDRSGNIWVSTSKGLARISRRNFKVINFNYKDGLQGNEFSDGASYGTKDGKQLYFGGTNGLNVIYPSLMEKDNFMPRIVPDRVWIDNEIKCFSKTIDANYNTGSIRLSFSILDYIDNDKCRLAYHLTRKTLFGKENQPWIFLNNNNKEIILNKLPPGTYLLSVIQSNANQKWSSHPYTLRIVVHSPLWLQWWAILIYILLGAGIIRWVYHSKKAKLIIKHKLEMQEQQQQQREDIHHAKLRFFTNATHDFSNSITLIYGAVEKLKKNKIMSKLDRGMISVIDKNTNIMDKQIQQLTEFQDIETKSIEIFLEEVNIAELEKYILDNFIDPIQIKGINLSFKAAPPVLCWSTDRSILEKITYIIFSNAVKSTIKNGQMIILSRVYKQELIIECTYEGMGPDPEDLANIYNKYTALDKFEKDMSNGSKSYDSIGLAVCNDLIKILDGTFSIDTKGTSTVFTLTLPRKMKASSNPPVLMQESRKDTVATIFTEKLKKILIVEKQKEMADLIKDALQERYDVFVTSTDKESKDLIEKTSMNLIIYDLSSDVKAEELINDVKNGNDTKYIPIIVLSSDPSTENHIKILENGASMFIQKPFYPSYLQAAVRRILQENDLMKNFSSSPLAFREKYDNISVTEQDKKFLKQSIEVISRNFSDEDYDQNTLSKDLTISRTQLYRKMKRLTGMTPGDFIRTYRMKQAERMLIQSDHTVSEIIVACGFRNRAYFYRKFTEIHNCSPKDFKEQKGEGQA